MAKRLGRRYVRRSLAFLLLLLLFDFFHSFLFYLFIFSSQLIALRSMRLVLKGIKAANAQHTGDTRSEWDKEREEGGDGEREREADRRTDKRQQNVTVARNCHCPTVPRFFFEFFFVAHCRSI